MHTYSCRLTSPPPHWQHCPLGECDEPPPTPPVWHILCGSHTVWLSEKFLPSIGPRLCAFQQAICCLLDYGMGINSSTNVKLCHGRIWVLLISLHKLHEQTSDPFATRRASRVHIRGKDMSTQNCVSLAHAFPMCAPMCGLSSGWEVKLSLTRRGQRWQHTDRRFFFSLKCFILIQSLF